jgi:hypothetical protein
MGIGGPRTNITSVPALSLPVPIGPSSPPAPPPRAGADFKRRAPADLRNGPPLDSLVALRPHQPGARGGLTCGLPTAREPGDLAVRSVILGMIGAVLRMRPKSENQLLSVIYENILQCLLACFRQMLLVAQAACRRSGDCTRKSSGWAVDRPAPSIHAGQPLCTDVQIAKSGEPHRLPVTEDLIRSLCDRLDPPSRT